MSTGIGNSNSAIGAAQGVQKPDAAQLIGKLFSRVDAGGQGSIDKAALETAFSKLYAAGAGKPGSPDSAASADAVFKALDSNGDGKLTKQEATDSLNNILSQIDKAGGQRAEGAHKAHHGHHGHHVEAAAATGGAADLAGVSKDQLSAKASELASSNSKLSAFMSNIASNFSAADSNGDGKLNVSELRAFVQSRQASPAAGAAAPVTAPGSAGDTGSATDAGQPGREFMQKAAQLMRAYGGPIGGVASTLSVLA
jgi:Ca2+-binding EF-hand superfamily protein